ncbi:ABC-type multidrug transport system, permease component [Thaumarchaeota archaeon SCGC AB-539-E09]|nr:ABC-type multidrug transport system, permease component [Thaumarchaeota archaeon SCGC AB-539-E09]
MTVMDELEGVMAILEKDLRAYYFKPPNISWGILFPIVLALSFSLRNPEGLRELAPGLIAMTALFGTTSMEAIVITFEKRVGALERLQLAPITDVSIIIGKVLGGTIFGLIISLVMTMLVTMFLGAAITNLPVFTLTLLLTLVVHSALGALVAVSVKEVFEAQTLSNYFRFPMIFLCGIFLPLEKMPIVLQYLARILPLTYSVETLRASMSGYLGNSLLNILILSIYSVFLLVSSVMFFRKNQDN